MAPVLTWMDAVVVMVRTQHRPGRVPHEQWSTQSTPGAGIAPLVPARTLSSHAAGGVRAFGPDRDSEAGSGVSHMPLMVAVHLAHRSTVRPAVYGSFFSPMVPLGLPSGPVLGMGLSPFTGERLRPRERKGVSHTSGTGCWPREVASKPGGFFCFCPHRVASLLGMKQFVCWWRGVGAGGGGVGGIGKSTCSVRDQGDC